MGYIKSKIIYHDRLSQSSTYPYGVKPKNKLAGHCIQEDLGVYLFFVLSSSNAAFIKRFTVEYNSTDHISNKHIDFKTRYMASEVGYCDVTRFELMTHDVAIAKKADHRNGFVKVGILDNSKWKEIQNIIVSPEFIADSKGGQRTPHTLNDLIKGVNTKDIAQSLIVRLGI